MNAIPGLQDNLLNKFASALLLRQTYFPSHADNLMQHEGDVELARKNFLKSRTNKLSFLLEKRFAWMNQYIEGKQEVVEIGAGAGFSKFFITNPNFKLTDFVKYPWIDYVVDAMNPPWEPASLDVLVSSHMIHHLYSPAKFFKSAHKALRLGGLIVIQEINTSYLMRLMLRAMRHEGWSYDIDVFDEQAISNDPSDPWSANCAIPQMLFSNSAEFERRVPGFKIILNRPCECFIFPLSGGVIAKAGFLNFDLPLWALHMTNKIDEILVKAWPSMFALGRNVVLQKA